MFHLNSYQKYFICSILFFLCFHVSAQTNTDGLVAHYLFDNETLDKSGNNNNGQIVGGVTTAEDRFGNPCGAMRFNGTDGYITAPNSPSLKSPSSSFSSTVWFKLEKGKSTSNDINMVLFSKSGTANKALAKAQYRFILSRAFGDATSNISLSNDITAQDENYNAHQLEWDQWYFLAVVYEDNWVNIFLNNKLIAQAIVKKPFVQNDLNLEIGRDVTETPKYFSGCLDDLRIYNRALSPIEVTDLYNEKPATGTLENLAVSFPKNVEKNTDPGKCYTAVSFTEPVATSGCGKVELKQEAGPASGSLFGPGQNIVSFEATTSSGKKIVDSLFITIHDNEPPVCKCPPDTNVNFTVGTKTKIDYPLPVATDNCKNVDIELVSGPASGGEFPEGITMVKYKATDASDNSSECSFRVNVTKNIQRILHCSKDIIAYTSANAENVVVNYEIPYIDENGNKVEMKRTKGFSSGSLFSIGQSEIIYELKDSIKGDMACSFSITVKDTIPPFIVCPIDIKKIVEAGQTTAIVNYTIPKASDSGYKDSVQLVAGLPSGSNFPIGTTVIKYQAIDDSQNKSECSFKVTVEEKIPPVRKKAEPTKPETTEIKTAEIKQVPPVPSVIDDTEQNIKAAEKSFIPPVAESKIKTEEKEPITSNSTTEEKIKAAEKAFFPEEAKAKPPVTPKEIIKEEQSKTPEPPKTPAQPKTAEQPIPTVPVVEKKDEPKAIVKIPDTAPAKAIILNCPKDIAKNTDHDKCGVVVHYSSPSIHSGNGVKITQTKGNASGTLFKPGTTTNTFLATDIAGYTKECSFQITVKDKEPPVFNCPNDTTIILPINRRGIVYFYNDPTVKDNCGIDSIIKEAGPKNGCFLEVGVHPFIYKAIDVSGNYQICTHSVIIKTGAPAVNIAAPESIDANLNLGSDSIHYEYEAETKNCLLTVFIYDDGEEDGDTVSIIFNGQVIVNHEMLRIKEHAMIKRTLVLDAGNENYIVSKAWNTGKYGLNTLRMDVYEGDIENDKSDLRGKKPVASKVIHSKPGIAGGMILKCKD